MIVSALQESDQDGSGSIAAWNNMIRKVVSQKGGGLSRTLGIHAAYKELTEVSIRNCTSANLVLLMCCYCLVPLGYSKWARGIFPKKVLDLTKLTIGYLCTPPQFDMGSAALHHALPSCHSMCVNVQFLVLHNQSLGIFWLWH